MRGCSLRELAQKAGLNKNACSIALSRPWPTVERLIAKFLGWEAKDIWPDRYDSQGQPLRGGYSTLKYRRAS